MLIGCSIFLGQWRVCRKCRTDSSLPLLIYLHPLPTQVCGASPNCICRSVKTAHTAPTTHSHHRRCNLFNSALSPRLIVPADPPWRFFRRTVTVEKCHNSTIVLGVVKTAVNLVACENVKLITICDRLFLRLVCPLLPLHLPPPPPYPFPLRTKRESVD